MDVNGIEPPNFDGPAPLPDKSNVAIQFFAFGDTPYDGYCETCNTCINNGVFEQNCTLYDCILKNIGMSGLDPGNTCTYQGPDYSCIQNSLMPYMNAQIALGEAAFIAHCGDFLSSEFVDFVIEEVTLHAHARHSTFD